MYRCLGFRTYDNWTTTILNDEGFAIRNDIQNWMYRLSGGADGTRSTTAGLTNSTGDATVTQVGADGADVQTWKFYNLWPTELSEIALDWCIYCVRSTLVHLLLSGVNWPCTLVDLELNGT